MDNADSLLGGFAAGDKGPLDEPLAPNPIKREHDSMDDFEHLERRPEVPTPAPEAARVASQSLLDMEREPFGEPRAPSVASLADKFTDSESDTGESPLHRPQPPAPALQLKPEPLVSLEPEPTPAPAAAPPPVRPSPLLPEPALQPAPAPRQEAPQPAPAPAPAPAPQPHAEPPQPRPLTSPPQPKVAAPSAPPKSEVRPPVAHVIEAEVIFCQMGLDAWFDPQRLHPEVESLIYWRSPARSGAALGLGLVLLVALACCSVVSVLAYAALLALSAAVAFRVYKNVLQAVQKTNEGHPFKWLLEHDISVPADRAQSLAAAATAHLNAALTELRRLFLVEDLVDSLKFGVLLWCLTYVGACFNGITLIILGWIALFTLPKAYEMNKPQVDANLELARAKINEISAKVRAAVPLGRKSESEKDK